MKKVIFILIGISLVAVLFVGCGEKKSAGVIKCEENMTELSINLPKKLHDSGGLTDAQYEDAIAEGNCAVKACALYKGGASDEEIGKWMMEGGAKKCQ
jgi:hypothetical protein